MNNSTIISTKSGNETPNCEDINQETVKPTIVKKKRKLVFDDPKPKRKNSLAANEKIKELLRENSFMKRKLTRTKQMNTRLRLKFSKLKKEASVSSLLDKHKNPLAAELFKNEIVNGERQAKGRMYTPAIKDFAKSAVSILNQDMRKSSFS